LALRILRRARLLFKFKKALAHGRKVFPSRRQFSLCSSKFIGEPTRHSITRSVWLRRL